MILKFGPVQGSYVSEIFDESNQGTAAAGADVLDTYLQQVLSASFRWTCHCHMPHVKDTGILLEQSWLFVLVFISTTDKSLFQLRARARTSSRVLGIRPGISTCAIKIPRMSLAVWFRIQRPWNGLHATFLLFNSVEHKRILFISQLASEGYL